MVDEFIDKVVGYTTRNPNCAAREMAELAPGLVTVYDVSNEYDTYFDSSRWGESNPGFWEDSLFITNDPSMGVLQGVGTVPQVNSFDASLEFANRNLKSTSDIAMYDQPRTIELDERLAHHRSRQ